MDGVPATVTLPKGWHDASDVARYRARWMMTARPEQITPDGDWWNTWLFQAGRGSGKTRACAEDFAYYGLTHPRSRMAIVAPTFADGRDTCIEGVSGLLSCVPHARVQGWNRSLGEMVLTNGTRYKLFGAYSEEDVKRLRGPQHHRAWVEELAQWRRPEAWEMLLFGLRLGVRPRVVGSTTPRSVALIRDLVAREGADVVVSRGTMWDNIDNLSEIAVTELRKRYEGTRLGRQELLGELLEDVEGALWRRDWITYDEWPLKQMRRVSVGLDPSDGSEDGAEFGLATIGQAVDGRLFVLHSDGLRGSPMEMLKAAVTEARRVRGKIVVEKNHGGAFLVELLNQAMSQMGVRVPYRVVDAGSGKATRAEPVAALYEQGGRIAHAREFDVLEDQMTTWTGDGKSPDRMDALVWAALDLMGYAGVGGPTSGKAVPYSEGDQHAQDGSGAVPWR